MRFDLIRPCRHCPFRSDLPPFITQARAREILAAITGEQKTFSCHKTVDYSDEESCGQNRPDTQHCAGALILLERLDRPNQMMRIAERLHFYDRTKLDMQSPVYATPRAMIAAHKGRR